MDIAVREGHASMLKLQEASEFALLPDLHLEQCLSVLQAAASMVPNSAATHFILALDKWKDARLKRRQERRVASEVEGQQRWPAKLVADISEP